MQQSTYLVIPRMTVANVNLMQAWWLAGAPGPMAALGFAHNLARHLGTSERGVGIVHHDLQILAEDTGTWATQPQQFRAASFIDKKDYAKGALALSLQPTFKGHLKVSLVIEFPEGSVKPETVMSFLSSARYAGGLVNKTWKPWEAVNIDEAVRKLKSGFAVCDRTAWVQAAMDQGQDPLDAILELTRAEHAKDQPWCTPTLLGYAALTDFAARRGVREDALHAFAEPLVGLVQYRPVREGLPLWRRARPSDSVFLATQDPAGPSSS